MSGSAGDVENSGASGTIPELIRSAGDDAVRAYGVFFDDAKWSPSTLKLYGLRARRFFRWDEGKELSLAGICAFDAVFYESELSRSSPGLYATSYRSLLNRLFGHLKNSGVIVENPFDESAPGGGLSEDAAAAWQATVDAAAWSLMMSDLRQFGALKGGEQVNAQLCERILALGEARGITPLSWLRVDAAPDASIETGRAGASEEAVDTANHGKAGAVSGPAAGTQETPDER
jgi:hypothetical protein